MMAAPSWGRKLAVPHLSTSNLRYAVKTALAILVVWFSLDLVGVRNPVFALISVVVVAEPQLGTSLFLAWSRLLATVIGVAAALAVVVVLGVNPWALALAIFVVVLLCTEIFEVPGAWKLGPATSALIIGLAAAGGPEHPGLSEAWHIALARFWETIYGIAVTVAISRFLWPEWSRERLRRAAAAYCHASAHRLDHILAMLAGRREGERDGERSAIIGALRQLDSTVIDARHERWHRDAPEQITTTILAASRAFYDSCLVIERLAPRSAHEAASDATLAATEDLLTAMHDRLERTAMWLGRREASLSNDSLEISRRALEAERQRTQHGVGQPAMPGPGLTASLILAEAVDRAAGDLETLSVALAKALPAKI